MAAMIDPSGAVLQDPRWQRVAARDGSADGQFWYSVTTTRIYCRPSCPSRLPNPQHVRFHASPAEAEAAGCRACRRCNPCGLSVGAANATLIAKACRLIDAADTPPSLAALAQSVELSPSHFHRLFKSLTGITPRAYAAARRAARVRRLLGAGTAAAAGTVTQAIYAAGFNSSGRFYAATGDMLGMTPSRYRAGGAAEVLHFAVGQCSLGAILVAASATGVAAILIGDDPQALIRDLQDRFTRATLIGGDADFEAKVAQVVGFVEAPRLGLELPLDVRGTAFQRRVWQALRDIPAGTTVTYSDLAGRIGAPTAVRAVAGACAANALAVAIPCHRVIRHDGRLAGYRWGIARKRVLLAREAQD